MILWPFSTNVPYQDTQIEVPTYTSASSTSSTFSVNQNEVEFSTYNIKYHLPPIGNVEIFDYPLDNVTSRVQEDFIRKYTENFLINRWTGFNYSSSSNVTYDSYTLGNWEEGKYNQYNHKKENKKEIMQRLVQSRMKVQGRNRLAIKPPVDEREERARETLRSFIGEDRWKRFVRDGFITVFSHKDKKTYQIFPGTEMSNITKVYDKGKMVERLCCYLKGGFPETDHLLMRFLLILNSPEEFRRLSIVHNVPRPTYQKIEYQGTQEDLVTEFRRLKLIA